MQNGFGFVMIFSFVEFYLLFLDFSLIMLLFVLFLHVLQNLKKKELETGFNKTLPIGTIDKNPEFFFTILMKLWLRLPKQSEAGNFGQVGQKLSIFLLIKNYFRLEIFFGPIFRY